MNATPKEDLVGNWVAVALFEINPDERIATGSPEDRLFGYHERKSIDDEINIRERFGDVRTFHVVSENQSGFEAGHIEVAAECDIGSGVIVASGCADESGRGHAVEDVVFQSEALNTPSDKSFSAKRLTVFIQELNPDERISSNAAQDRLFGNGDLTAKVQQDHIRFETNDCGMRTFQVILECEGCLQAAESDFAIESDLRSWRIIAASLVHV